MLDNISKSAGKDIYLLQVANNMFYGQTMTKNIKLHFTTKELQELRDAITKKLEEK